ncbi:hypothetical protein BD410DRAFT_892999 [Rickenella mellea]|uniref:Nucleic acid-binding protein n=1 Tax=Rickenella mellea TaxID=50990 RepID=A0A4R5XG50_9AGAM|nr:hypothetical protein BD410DRAFT_892999 [Rickenella mellea]
MFSFARSAVATGRALRTFSTTGSRNSDLAKLILIGRLGKDPETRQTQSQKDYIHYTVATTNYPPPPPGPDGTRPASRTSWHSVLCFNPSVFDYLRTLTKGSHVYVEANYELRDADPAADPDSPQGQRQIFLRHETIRLLRSNQPPSASNEDTSS